MNVTTVKCLLANETTVTCHVRHISCPLTKLLKDNLSHATIVKCNHSILSNQKGLLQAK